MSPHHCNCDPDIWGVDANEWKPERWLTELPPSVAEARVPGVYSNLLVRPPSIIEAAAELWV